PGYFRRINYNIYIKDRNIKYVSQRHQTMTFNMHLFLSQFRGKNSTIRLYVCIPKDFIPECLSNITLEPRQIPFTLIDASRSQAMNSFPTYLPTYDIYIVTHTLSSHE